MSEEIQTMEDLGFHGDCAIVRLADDESILEGLKPMARDAKGRLVVAGTMSGQGHLHVIDHAGSTMFSTDDPLETYLRVKDGPAIIRHEKTGPSAHLPIRIPEGVYRVRRQREMTPEGWRQIED